MFSSAFNCIGCIVFGSNCFQALCDAHKNQFVAYLAWEPVRQISFILIGIPIAVFVIGYFGGTILKGIMRR